MRSAGTTKTRAFRLTLPALLLAVAALPLAAADYSSVQDGDWNNSATWTPAGVPDSLDNAAIAHRVALTTSHNVANLTIDSTGKLCSGPWTLSVFGNWTNNGSDSLTGGYVTFRGPGNVSISGSTVTQFYRLRVQKDTLTTTVTLYNTVIVAYNGSQALHITRGTFVTNGRNLSVNSINASVTGDTWSRLNINGGGTVSIYRLVQTNYLPSLSWVTISDSPTVNITHHDVGGSFGTNYRRCDISGGTINYLAGGRLYLIVNGLLGGWFATAGTITFYGDINATMVTNMRATGSSVVRFAGSTTSVWLLGNAWGGWQRDRTIISDLRVEKTAGCTLRIASDGTMLIDTSMIVGSLLVDSGVQLVLACSTFRDTGNRTYGYVFNNVTNNGSIALIPGDLGHKTRYIYVNGDWIDNGLFEPWQSVVTFFGPVNRDFAPGPSSAFYDMVVSRPGALLTPFRDFRVRRNLNVQSGRLTLNRRKLTLGLPSIPGNVDVAAGASFTAIGSLDTFAVVTAADSGTPYRFAVADGGSIAARHARFSYPDTLGILVCAGATIDPVDNFSFCSFDHGSITGPLLKVENDQLLDTVYDADFSAAAGYNVEKVANAGRLIFRGGFGNYWGPTFESDPNSLIDWVHVVDVGIARITAPTGALDSGVSTTPACSVYNHGNLVADYAVRMRIGSGYNLTAAVTAHAPRTAVYLTFPAWTAIERGANPVVCSTELSGDARPSNDRAVGSVEVAVHDIGAVQVLAPSGVMSPGTMTPQAAVNNFGTVREACDVTLTIDCVPAYGQTISLPAGLPFTDTVLDFPAWTATPGSFLARCSTFLTLDNVPANDIARLEFRVLNPDTGWTRKADMPLGGRSKKVKDGGCMAHHADPTDQSDPAIYALKGNNRAEFYRYDIISNAWVTKESIPAVGSAGKKKLVKKGASLVSHTGRLYATKGGNTLEYWRYDPMLSGTPTYPWTQLGDVPSGAKNIKEGSGQVAVGDYIYLLRGSATTDFYQYDPTSGNWTSLAAAPTGVSGKPFKNGSSICTDGVNTIYALKGTYGEFYAYRVDSNAWTTLADLPKTGSAGKKKVKTGSSSACDNGIVYALKGGNTVEFWSYQVDSNRWTELANMPLAGGKKVKGGGSLVHAPSANALFALKGNNTVEFFRYGLSSGISLSARQQARNAQGSDRLQAASFKLDVFPNPFSGSATITYSLPRDGNVSLKLYDAGGRLVSTLVNAHRNSGTHSLFSALHSLSMGVFILRLEASGSTSSIKLIVE